jgi:hypothetical protein
MIVCLSIFSQKQEQKQIMAENTNRFLARLRQLGNRILGEKDIDLLLNRLIKYLQMPGMDSEMANSLRA